MNSLSWLVYLADILGNLQPLCIASGFLILSCGGVVWFGAVIDAETYPTTMRRLNYGAVVMIIIGALLPSSSTVKAITASEFGERILKSERAQGIIDPGLKFIENWLKDKAKAKE